MYDDIVWIKLFDGVTVNASSTSDSDIIDLGALGKLGSFTLQLYVTGAGASVTATVLQSNVPGTSASWVTPTGVADICTNYPGAADQDYEIFDIGFVASPRAKIRLTETQGAAATVSGWLAAR